MNAREVVLWRECECERKMPETPSEQTVFPCLPYKREIERVRRVTGEAEMRLHERQYAVGFDQYDYAIAKCM